VKETETIISGKVTDFHGDPLSNAVVELENPHFNASYKTCTNDDGEYEMIVRKGLYLALAVFKDYKTRYLEYWAWNVPAYQDLQFNPRIEGIEVYAMNAFKPQGAYPSLIIYFRPMSLRRSRREEGTAAPDGSKVINISPELTKDDIEVRIKGNLLIYLSRTESESTREESIRWWPICFS
jgi:hypothetical protein